MRLFRYVVIIDNLGIANWSVRVELKEHRYFEYEKQKQMYEYRRDRVSGETENTFGTFQKYWCNSFLDLHHNHCIIFLHMFWIMEHKFYTTFFGLSSFEDIINLNETDEAFSNPFLFHYIFILLRCDLEP